ncbi:hypothetical protein ACFQZ2_17335 [Streptomonospora algeriensis]|uniref:Ig-like domain-containing protein n=1 Tax=Streptomonospora algeriensis TaxID=995084 RepID=A0ABW3BC08_9ACTN
MGVRRTAATLAIPFVMGLAAVGLSAVPAAAADGQPCAFTGDYRTMPTGNTVQVRWCPDWSPRSDGRIPVYEAPSGGSVAGWINNTGTRTNWYVCQVDGARHSAGGYWNTWWALTKSDTGQWGWVSEVYFRGGGNGERDGGLPVGCPPLG